MHFSQLNAMIYRRAWNQKNVSLNLQDSQVSNPSKKYGMRGKHNVLTYNDNPKLCHRKLGSVPDRSDVHSVLASTEPFADDRPLIDP